jgi:hypothetical protein
VRSPWLAVTALLAGLANALAAPAAPEAGYLASRDAYIRKIDAIHNPQEQEQEADRAAKELTALLRRLLGPIEINGLSPGAAQVEMLIRGYGGSADLDGLLFSSQDDSAWVLATTRGLLRRWARMHADMAGRPDAPESVLLKLENFYTQARFEDAAVQRYAEIPIAKPAHASFAYAMLVTRTNDGIKSPPNEIVLSVVSDERVFIANTKLKTKIDPIAACEQLWAAYEAKWAKKGARDHEEKADAEYRGCFAKRAKSQAFLQPLTNEAQSLVDVLPAQ